MLAFEQDARKVRHETNNRVQKDYFKLDEKMDENQKSILKLEGNMDSVKKDIKNGFVRMEEKLEEKFNVMMDKFATKLELQSVKSDTDSNSAIIKWVIWVATTIFTAWIIYLLTMK